MRQGPSNRRPRGRGNNSGRRGNLPNRNQTFDSNGPDVRIRGTAVQVNEKYLALARDATTSGDRVMAESYFQHAEHYHRIIASINEAHAQSQVQPEGANRQREDGQREDGQRDDQHRRSSQHENGHRDSGNRDNRDNSNRDSGNRENGHRGNSHRDAGNRDSERQRDSAPPADTKRSESQPEMEFGEDPRQGDVRDTPLELTNGEAVIEVVGLADPPPAEPVEAAAGNGKSSEAPETDGDVAPAAKPRRRGPGRPRKTAVAKDAVVPEANTDGD